MQFPKKKKKTFAEKDGVNNLLPSPSLNGKRQCVRLYRTVDKTFDGTVLTN